MESPSSRSQVVRYISKCRMAGKEQEMKAYDNRKSTEQELFKYLQTVLNSIGNDTVSSLSFLDFFFFIDLGYVNFIRFK